MRRFLTLLGLLLCGVEALLFQWSERKILQEINLSSDTMSKILLMLMKNNQYQLTLALLKAKSFDFQSLYDSKCNQMSYDNVIRLEWSLLPSEDLKLLMSSDCMANLRPHILPFATALEGNVLESENIVRMEPSPIMNYFVDQALKDDERAHLVRWDLIPFLRRSQLTFSILDNLKSNDRWQVFTAVNFAQNSFFTNTVTKRSSTIKIIAQSVGYSTNSLLLKLITLKAVALRIETEYRTYSRLSEYDYLNSNVIQTRKVLEKETSKLQELIPPSNELATKIQSLPANSESTVHEILLLTSHEVVYGDWFENLLMIVDIKAISGTVLVPLLDQMFRKKLSTACIPRIIDLLLEAKVQNVIPLLRPFLLQFPQHIPVLYEKHREFMSNALVIETIPFRQRILHNLRTARRSKNDGKVHFLSAEKGLKGFASLIASLFNNRKLSLMDNFLMCYEPNEGSGSCDHGEITIQKMIRSYYEMFLSIPKLYRVHGRATDGRPIISLSLKFAPKFWEQFAHLMSFCFALKEPLPFVFEREFFDSLFATKSNNFAEDDAEELVPFYAYLERNIQFAASSSIQHFISHWAKIISKLDTKEEIHYPLTILMPGSKEESHALRSVSVADKVKTLFWHAKTFFVDGLENGFYYHDFTLDELYSILFNQ